MQTSTAQIALVRGANKGIGLEITRQIGGAGARMLLGACDVARDKAAAAALRTEGIEVRCIQLDLGVHRECLHLIAYLAATKNGSNIDGPHVRSDMYVS
jgi:short-subunit dehydrogenase